MRVYWYGMKLRGYSIGCQPMNGLVSVRDVIGDVYYNVLIYERKLTNQEVYQYDLEYLGEETNE